MREIVIEFIAVVITGILAVMIMRIFLTGVNGSMETYSSQDNNAAYGEQLKQYADKQEAQITLLTQGDLVAGTNYDLTSLVSVSGNGQKTYKVLSVYDESKNECTNLVCDKANNYQSLKFPSSGFYQVCIRASAGDVVTNKTFNVYAR